MAYYGSTQASSIANPPKMVTSPLAMSPALAGSTNYLTTQGSTYANNSNAPGGAGANLWVYASTNLTTDLTAANFFSDGFYLGMKAGDIVQGAQYSSLGSTVTSFMGVITSVTTAGASLSTGSLMTSTFS